MVEMSHNNETKQVNHKVGASDQIFVAIQNLVASVAHESGYKSENMIWVLKELSEKWTMKTSEITRRMREGGYSFSDSLTGTTLKLLFQRGLVRRPRHGVYQASFDLIFLQALRSSGYGDLARELSKPGGELKA